MRHNKSSFWLQPGGQFSLTFFLFLYLLPVASLIFMASCSFNQLAEHRPIVALTLQDSLDISYHIDKVSYSPVDRTFFLLDRTANTVRIYKNGVFFNEIGGAGFASDNFRRLTDICAGIDGSLYTLDSFERSIKRFDKDGIFVSQILLDSLSSPERIAMTSFGSIFVYDSHSKEIFALDTFDLSVIFTFGKFQIDRADAFFIAGEHINVFDSNTKETSVFLINGMFENSFKGFTFFDALRNTLSLSDDSLVANRGARILFNTDRNINAFNLEREFFVFYIAPQMRGGGTHYEGGQEQIMVYRGVYETR